jgi:polar amino acid transport system substrate-binding protein
MEFKGLIPALQGKRMTSSTAMYIKPERAEQVDFIPYLKVGEVMVKKAIPRRFRGR